MVAEHNFHRTFDSSHWAESGCPCDPVTGPWGLSVPGAQPASRSSAGPRSSHWGPCRGSSVQNAPPFGPPFPSACPSLPGISPLPPGSPGPQTGQGHALPHVMAAQNSSCLSPTSVHRLQACSRLDSKSLHGAWHPGGLRSALAKPVGHSARLWSVAGAPGELQASRAEEPLFL